MPVLAVIRTLVAPEFFKLLFDMLAEPTDYTLYFKA